MMWSGGAGPAVTILRLVSLWLLQWGTVWAQDADFAVFTSPRGGEALVVGDVLAIAWQAAGGDASTYTGQVALRVEGVEQLEKAAVLPLEIANSIPYTFGRYNWTVSLPSNTTSLYTIRISPPDSNLSVLSPTFTIKDPRLAASSNSDFDKAANDSGLSSGDIAGIAAGGAFGAFLIAGALWIFCYLRRSSGRLRALDKYLRRNPQAAMEVYSNLGSSNAAQSSQPSPEMVAQRGPLMGGAMGLSGFGGRGSPTRDGFGGSGLMTGATGRTATLVGVGGAVEGHSHSHGHERRSSSNGTDIVVTPVELPAEMYPRMLGESSMAAETEPATMPAAVAASASVQSEDETTGRGEQPQRNSVGSR